MTKSIEESDQQSHLPETAMSTEPYAKQTTHDFLNSSPLDIGCSGSNNGDRSMSDSAILTENDEVAKGDLDIGETSATLVLCKTPHDIKSITGNENSTLKLPLFTQASDSTVDKVMLRNQSEAGEFHSKISKRLEDTGSHLYQPPLIGAKSLLSGNKKIGTKQLHSAIEKGVGSCNTWKGGL
ncbi:hypothetical protein M0R45_013377 [Rubus argutus]|uniref:Uncharacterized protein n=1 Tax=Rubus argutus TaxID=59490 RepID=A0AAW1XI35_RUBAR